MLTLQTSQLTTVPRRIFQSLPVFPQSQGRDGWPHTANVAHWRRGASAADDGPGHLTADTDNAGGTFRKWDRSQSLLQIEEDGAVSGLAVHRNNRDLSGYRWQALNPSSAHAFIGPEHPMLLGDDSITGGQNARRKRLLHRVSSHEPRPDFLQHSVTTTNTPSAFTITDPFDAWTAPSPRAPTTPTTPSELPTAKAVAPEPALEPAPELAPAKPPPPQPAGKAQGDEVDSGAQPGAAGADQVDSPARASAEAAAAFAAAKEATERQAQQEAKNVHAVATERQPREEPKNVQAEATERQAQEEPKNVQAGEKEEGTKREEPAAPADGDAASEQARAGRRKAVALGAKSLEKALAAKVEKLKLTDQETKDFVDTKGKQRVMPGC